MLCHEKRFSNDNQSELPVFESTNEDEMAVYDFLEDVGDFYIDRFLQNGYTAMHFVLFMEKENLKQMNVKMAHINYIWHKIQTFDQDTFDSMRATKKAQREQIRQKIEAERLEEEKRQKQAQIEKEKREQAERERIEKIENERIAQLEAERLRKEQIEKDRLEKEDQQRIEEQKEREFERIKQQQKLQDCEQSNLLIPPPADVNYIKMGNMLRRVGTGNYPSSPSSVSESDLDVLHDEEIEETKGGPDDDNDKEEEKEQQRLNMDEKVSEDDGEKIIDNQTINGCKQFLVEAEDGSQQWKSRKEVEGNAYYIKYCQERDIALDESEIQNEQQQSIAVSEKDEKSVNVEEEKKEIDVDVIKEADTNPYIDAELMQSMKEKDMISKSLMSPKAQHVEESQCDDEKENVDVDKNDTEEDTSSVTSSSDQTQEDPEEETQENTVVNAEFTKKLESNIETEQVNEENVDESKKENVFNENNAEDNNDEQTPII